MANMTREMLDTRRANAKKAMDGQGKQKTSASGLFTLETVACLGACGLAPVVTVNDQVHSKMTPETMIELLQQLEKEAEDDE